MYGIVYSISITSEYLNQRPNYFIYIYMITMISICNEIYAYYNVGLVKNERLKQIEIYKKENMDFLYWKKIPDEFVYYHIDSNSPSSEEYYAWDLFLKYYDLPNDTKILLVE